MSTPCSDGPIVVKAWAPSCGSCRALAPVVAEVADSTGVPLIELQIEEHPELAGDLGVRSLPTLIALRDGAELGRLVGLQPIDAVQSLFEVAAGTAAHVRPRAPASLVAARGLVGITLVTAGAVLGSVTLGLLGALGIVWAGYSLLRP